MKKFNFSFDEIIANFRSKDSWHNFVRNKEAEFIFSKILKLKINRCLEIGAGKGIQSKKIAKHCNKLISTEKFVDDSYTNFHDPSYNHLDNVEYLICDAEDLSQFEPNSFDLIFSSNVLEHIENIDNCLSECSRVLKNKGLMVHSMPNKFWKVFSFFLYFPKRRFPVIHGVSDSHIQEFFNFGMKKWISVFAANNFEVKRVSGLPFYSGHGNSYLPIVVAGNYFRISSTFLYISMKKDV